MRHSSHTIITHVVIKIWAFLILCFMITLLYIFAAVMTGLIVNVVISLWPSSGNSAHIPALLLFSTCTAGLTYSYLAFYLKKQAIFSYWYLINASSISLGAGALYFAGFIALIRENTPLALGTFAMIGGIVGGIQWLYLRNVIKDAYLWVLAMVWCWLLYGYFLLVFLPATVRALI